MNLLNRRRALMHCNKNILPSVYQQVEYLESTGTQYIDTGYVPTENTEILLAFQFVQKGRVFGASLNSIIATFSSSREGISFKFGNSEYSFFTPSINKIYTLNYSKNGVLIDDELQFPFSYTTFEANSSIFLCNTNTGTSGTLAKLKIRSFKIFNDNILVCNFLPCYRKADNEAGLYDVINDIFYTNQGTGSFKVGEIV